MLDEELRQDLTILSSMKKKIQVAHNKQGFKTFKFTDFLKLRFKENLGKFFVIWMGER